MRVVKGSPAATAGLKAADLPKTLRRERRRPASRPATPSSASTARRSTSADQLTDAVAAHAPGDRIAADRVARRRAAQRHRHTRQRPRNAVGDDAWTHVPESAQQRVTVVVADDHPLYRDGVVRALRASGQVEVVAEAGDGRTALDEIAAPPAGRRAARLQAAGARRRRGHQRGRPRRAADARAAGLRLHRQRRRLPGAGDGRRRLRVQGGAPRADRRRRAGLRARRERRAAGRRGRPRLRDPAAAPGRHARADPARAGDPAPHRRRARACRRSPRSSSSA